MLHARSVSDAIASIGCGLVVQQVVRLAVRLADCCMQLVVYLLCDKLSNLLWDLLFVLQLVARLAVGFPFVVHLPYSLLYHKSTKIEKKWSPTLCHVTLFSSDAFTGCRRRSRFWRGIIGSWSRPTVSHVDLRLCCQLQLDGTGIESFGDQEILHAHHLHTAQHQTCRDSDGLGWCLSLRRRWNLLARGLLAEFIVRTSSSARRHVGCGSLTGVCVRIAVIRGRWIHRLLLSASSPVAASLEVRHPLGTVRRHRAVLGLRVVVVWRCSVLHHQSGSRSVVKPAERVESMLRPRDVQHRCRAALLPLTQAIVELQHHSVALRVTGQRPFVLRGQWFWHCTATGCLVTGRSPHYVGNHLVCNLQELLVDFFVVTTVVVPTHTHNQLPMPVSAYSTCNRVPTGLLSSSSSFGMHHQCVAPLAANSPHSGLFW